MHWGILWWITACWAVSQPLNLAAVRDGHLHRSEKPGVEFLLSLLWICHKLGKVPYVWVRLDQPSTAGQKRTLFHLCFDFLLDQRERWKEPDLPNTKTGEFPCEKLILQEEKFYFKPTKDDYLKRNLVMGKAEKRKTQIVDMVCVFFSRTTKKSLVFKMLCRWNQDLPRFISGTWG